MADRSDYLTKAKDIWSRVRGFGMIWLSQTCLGGFVVLVGGPWVLELLMQIFGPAAARPRRVIVLLMIFSLPFTIYDWIQQRNLAEGRTACPQCGASYPKTNASCPMCGSSNSRENAANEKPAGKPVATTKS